MRDDITDTTSILSYPASNQAAATTGGTTE